MGNEILGENYRHTPQAGLKNPAKKSFYKFGVCTIHQCPSVSPSIVAYLIQDEHLVKAMPASIFFAHRIVDGIEILGHLMFALAQGAGLLDGRSCQSPTIWMLIIVKGRCWECRINLGCHAQRLERVENKPYPPR